ncbi:MAG: NUDIX domain-containing protein [Patescibacteria group bacterium]
MNKFKYSIYKLTHPFFRLYWRIFKPKTFGTKALLIYKDSILLTKNINSSHWGLPGGKIDKGETPEQCICRELQEELTLSCLVPEFKLGTFTSNNEGKRDTVYVFAFLLPSQDFTKQWELHDAEWFSITDLPKDTSPATLRRINEFKNNERNIVSIW